MAHSCSESGCCSPVLARGLCSKHYQRLRAAGGVPPRAEYATAEEFFWAHVDRAGPVPPHRPTLGRCWLWTGAVQGYGYGDTSSRLAPNRLAHRWSWLLHHGEIPHDLCVLHKCDVRRCVRPTHLFLGTQADNIADKVAKGRQARGERNGNARLRDAQYDEIVRRAGAGEGNSDIARSLGISPQMAHQIVKRRRALVTGG